ncbi:transcription factor bHLH10 [Raphanus sativus]|uniref:Transcription factor bHLH10 n=1 Tax=Raphanus sativus TaxID=3726 RepID=A0A6J0N2R3_RAPSA|nr:transcription factor bHLH10 [Raphanus sativus]XP_056862805.1 transcription factor bHLH10 [Raphanus sativus]
MEGLKRFLSLCSLESLILCFYHKTQRKEETFMDVEKGRNIYEEMPCFDPNTPASVTAESSCFSQVQPPQILVAGSTSNSNCSLDVEEFHLSPQDCPQASPTPLHQFHINPPTERERRVHFNDRFSILKNLIPNPTKSDRASIVGEAIDYIKELLRTIEEFKMLLEKKKLEEFRSMKKAKTDGEEEEEENNVSYRQQSQVDQSCFNKKSLRCSWLKRKSKVTEVDVRIIDDEVTIKVVQKKKINCLLFTTKALDQLKLDLHHVAGRQIGEHYSFLFNAKICEGSCVYASGIADTVMEAVEKQYMEAVPTNGY